jgi:hypothetical protein
MLSVPWRFGKTLGEACLARNGGRRRHMLPGGGAESGAKSAGRANRSGAGGGEEVGIG